MHLHGKPTYKRPHGDSLARSLPRRLPVPKTQEKSRHSCPPVHDPMFTLAPRRRGPSCRRPSPPAHGTAHDKNKAPHTSLCANPHDTDKSESKRILRRRSRKPRLQTADKSFHVPPRSSLGPSASARPTPPIQSNHIIRRAARELQVRSVCLATSRSPQMRLSLPLPDFRLSGSPVSLVEQLAAASQSQTSRIASSGIPS